MDPLAGIAQFGGEQGLDGGVDVFLFTLDADAVQECLAGDVRQRLHQRRRILPGQQPCMRQHARVGRAAQGVMDQQAHVELGIVTHGEAMDSLVERQTLGPDLSAHAACSLALSARATTMLPLPWLVKTSVSTASGITPLTRCALATPPARARFTAVSLGRMPPETLPEPSSPSMPSRVANGTRLEGRLMSSRRPGTFKRKNSFSAFKATATSAATVSALVLNTSPLSLAESGVITGTYSPCKRCCSSVGFTFSMSPTRPKSTNWDWPASSLICT